MRTSRVGRTMGMAGATPGWIGPVVIGAAVVANLALLVAVAVGRFG